MILLPSRTKYLRIVFLAKGKNGSFLVVSLEDYFFSKLPCKKLLYFILYVSHKINTGLTHDHTIFKTNLTYFVKCFISHVVDILEDYRQVSKWLVISIHQNY